MWRNYEIGKLPSTRPETKPAGTGGILEFVRERLKFEPDERQAAVLGGAYPRMLLNCSRQWGKSTITAARAVWEAYSKPGSLTLVVSPSGRQSAEFVRKAGAFVTRLDWPVRGDGDNEISLAMPNGSRIVGLPGNEETVRGFSAVSLLIIDEAARVRNAMYKALRPVRAVGDGDLWLLSTPYGKRGFFYDEWVGGSDRWVRVEARAAECGRITREFLAEEREAMGERWYRQEYECAFVDTVEGLFDLDVLRGLVGEVEGLQI